MGLSGLNIPYSLLHDQFIFRLPLQWPSLIISTNKLGLSWSLILSMYKYWLVVGFVNIFCCFLVNKTIRLLSYFLLLSSKSNCRINMVDNFFSSMVLAAFAWFNAAPPSNCIQCYGKKFNLPTAYVELLIIILLAPTPRNETHTENDTISQ